MGAVESDLSLRDGDRISVLRQAAEGVLTPAVGAAAELGQWGSSVHRWLEG